MIVILSEKMVDVIETCKMLIETAAFDPDNRALPQNVTLQSGNFFLNSNSSKF